MLKPYEAPIPLRTPSRRHRNWTGASAVWSQRL